MRASFTFREVLLNILQQRLDERTSAEWLDTLEGSGLAYGPINSIGEVFEDPQVQHRDMIMQLNHPTAGEIKLPGMPVKFSHPGTSENQPNVRTRLTQPRSLA